MSTANTLLEARKDLKEYWFTLARHAFRRDFDIADAELESDTPLSCPIEDEDPVCSYTEKIAKWFGKEELLALIQGL
jgi:hypothetical protein